MLQRLLFVLPVALAATVGAQTRTFQAASATCVEVVGATERDRDNALDFCARAIGKGDVAGVIARDSTLWIKVPRGFANALRMDSLSAEQLVKNWMRLWRQYSGRQRVTVYVEWQDVEVARGESTLRGDAVTLRR